MSRNMPKARDMSEGEMAIGFPLPHRRNEAWKWTDVRAFVPGNAAGISQEANPQFTASEEVKISRGDGHKGEGQMAKLAHYFAGESWNFYVAAGLKSATLDIENIARGHSHIAIMVDKGASLSMVEHHRAGSNSFANIDLQIHIAAGASLTRTIIHDDPADVTRISTACIAMEDDARLEQYTLSFGAGLTRFETRVHGEGENISAVINGTYLIDEKRHCDMTSHIELSAPNAHIRQAVKGVVTGKARGVFQGKFHVLQAAQLTDAEMRHDALMLSDSCEIRSKPELEIYADDVACAHGNTIGQLDEQALFYMRQRGIPVKAARALLTQAFVADVFDDMDDEDLRADILAKITTWLEA
ncbi:MAG: Fe-S cluster assembly protein SufD [Robiginitomaculum sp.]